MAQHALTLTTLEEFLDWEARSPIRHEFRAGDVWAMGGATWAHSLINMRLGVALANHLEGTPCEVVPTDIKVVIEAADASYYPDLVVVCEGIPEARSLEVRTPKILVEVFSPSTEGRDRGDKVRDYARIPTLREYVLINPEQHTVIVRRRAGPQDDWRTEALGEDDTLSLPSIDFACPVQWLYRGLKGIGE